jgi:hypothetical protein
VGAFPRSPWTDVAGDFLPQSPWTDVAGDFLPQSPWTDVAGDFLPQSPWTDVDTINQSIKVMKFTFNLKNMKYCSNIRKKNNEI